MEHTYHSNIKQFYSHNVIDSCSVSNILSSLILYKAAQSAQCKFYCTEYVLYECLFKRKKVKEVSQALQITRSRLTRAKNEGDFIKLNISIEDLQDIETLENRKKLSKGELSSMVMAKKYGQAFLTDDQKARRLACTYMEPSKVQTTPHLFGWLVFKSCLSDGDKVSILDEHENMGRTLSKFLCEKYMEALALRLACKSDQ